MNVSDAIRQRRSVRLFRNQPVPKKVLLEMADLARLYPSAGNMQPLRYGVVTKEPIRSQIFDCLRWAKYLPDFQIAADQRPQAYIVILGNREHCDFDAGAAAMGLLLAAKEAGLEGCCLGIGEKDAVRQVLGLDGALHPICVIALGYGAQESAEAPYEGDFRYFRDAAGKLHVPKHSLEEVLIYSDL